MFAAYSSLSKEETDESGEKKDNAQTGWLTNSSFQIPTNILLSSQNSSLEENDSKSAKPEIVTLSSDESVSPSKSPLNCQEDSLSSLSSSSDTDEEISKKSRKEHRRKQTSSESNSDSSDKHRRREKRSRSRSRSRRRDHKSSRFNKDRKDQKNRDERHQTKLSKEVLGFGRKVIKDDIIYEDKSRSFGNLNVPQLSRPAVPAYRALRCGLALPRWRRLQTKKETLKARYYNRIRKELKRNIKQNKTITIDTGHENPDGITEEDSIPIYERDSLWLERELTKTTAKFSKDLADEPQNVELWKKYVAFQDVKHQFESLHRQGGGASGTRVTADRKLAILDKALEVNPGSESLLKDRCLLAETVLPSDKLKQQLKSWTEADSGNVILWTALIMATQGSLSTCRVPSVTEIYREALTSIHNQGSSKNNSENEEKVLEILLHLGLFLQQAGLMELLWSLLNIYLEFNLAKLVPNKFKISSTIADTALTELEEVILGSQLPLPTLWLRVETLRAGTHWMPLPTGAESEDPQRTVFPEDIADFIHPINAPHLTFRLVTITLTLLKVPLLPWMETAARAAKLHPLPSLLDGPEPLYASLLQLGPQDFKETSSLLKDAAQLASGPQYLISRPGQDEYIDFISQVFLACADCLPKQQQTFIFIWCLRFYRWLMQLDRLGHCKLPQGRRKKMRTAAKDLLRRDCNRNNVLLFREFALLELECSGFDGAKKVLQGAISAQPSNTSIPISSDRGSVCSLYRTLAELFLSSAALEIPQKDSTSEEHRDIKSKNRESALNLLVSLGTGTSVSASKPTKEEIEKAKSKFHHVSKEVLASPSEGEINTALSQDVCHLSPTFLVEWSACQAWFLYLTKSVWEAASMLENILTHLDSNFGEESLHAYIIPQQKETLYELYISLLRYHSSQTQGSYGVQRQIILRALNEFPFNFTFLAALADLETSSNGTGLPLWRLSKVLYELPSAAAHALLVFVLKCRLKQQELAAANTRTLLNRGGPDISDPNVRNRISTLLRKLTNHPIMKRCPLLWRLRLQFTSVSGTDEDCKNAFYLALEECPWVKILYMDIVQALPVQLTQVQDLIIEKELRLHVTPEELEILRPEN